MTAVSAGAAEGELRERGRRPAGRRVSTGHPRGVTGPLVTDHLDTDAPAPDASPERGVATPDFTPPVAAFPDPPDRGPVPCPHR